MERAAILREVDEHGLSLTIRKHKLTASLIYKWRNRTSSDASLASKESEQELRRLRQEHQQLKELVAEKELTIRIKDTLLKTAQSKMVWVKVECYQKIGPVIT